MKNIGSKFEQLSMCELKGIILFLGSLICWLWTVVRCRKLVLIATSICNYIYYSFDIARHRNVYCEWLITYKFEIFSFNEVFGEYCLTLLTVFSVVRLLNIALARIRRRFQACRLLFSRGSLFSKMRLFSWIIPNLYFWIIRIKRWYKR